MKQELHDKGLYTRTQLLDSKLRLANSEGKLSNIRNSLVNLQTSTNQITKQMEAYIAERESDIQQQYADTVATAGQIFLGKQKEINNQIKKTDNCKPK